MSENIIIVISFISMYQNSLQYSSHFYLFTDEVLFSIKGMERTVSVSCFKHINLFFTASTDLNCSFKISHWFHIKEKDKVTWFQFMVEFCFSFTYYFLSDDSVFHCIDLHFVSLENPNFISIDDLLKTFELGIKFLS